MDCALSDCMYRRYWGNPRATQPSLLTVTVTLVASPTFKLSADADKTTEAVSLSQASVGVGVRDGVSEGWSSTA